MIKNIYCLATLSVTLKSVIHFKNRRKYNNCDPKMDTCKLSWEILLGIISLL